MIIMTNEGVEILNGRDYYTITQLKGSNLLSYEIDGDSAILVEGVTLDWMTSQDEASIFFYIRVGGGTFIITYRLHEEGITTSFMPREGQIMDLVFGSFTTNTTNGEIYGTLILNGTAMSSDRYSLVFTKNTVVIKKEV